MRTNHLIIAAVALTIAVGSLVVAGCGGGGSKSSAQPSGQPASAATKSQGTSEDDCTSLGHLTMDLALADTGFDYVRDRNFVDGYADHAPDEIGDSVDRLRDILDKFASAAEKAGLQPGDAPLPDQADEVRSAISYSEDDQAENARALQTVDTWVTNGCGA